MVMSFSDSSLRRRDLAGLAAAVAAVPVVALLPEPASAASATARSATRVRLAGDDDDALVSSAAVPLAVGAPGGFARRSATTRTAALDTDRFSMLGVTWQHGEASVRVRVRRAGGGWTGWQTLPALRDRPDPRTAEGAATPYATEPVWVGPSDGVQVELSGTSTSPVLTLIDPGRTAADSVVAPAAVPAPETAPAGVSARAARRPKRRPPQRIPAFYTRHQWGANPNWASGEPQQARSIKQVHVHHTVSANDYGPADVPAMLRGIYRYHTKSLGWSDVGYNFFVDRFGRIWAGRRRPKRETIGAHTLGFNHVSVGIAVLGNYQTAAATDPVVKAIARVAAWKLAKFHRNPLGTIKVRSHGSDRFPRGRVVVLPVIDGHRDTNDTACPGNNLYAALPAIRTRTARRIRRFNT
jgi:hypothetical protein